MNGQEQSLTELAKKGQVKILEDLWLSAIEEAGPNGQDDLLGALSTLNRQGQGERAAALGWTWLTTVKETAEDAADTLALGRELMLACGDSEEMRQEILSLYQELFADREELETLIEASGLTGGRSPRRALRTLEICLGLKVGDYLVKRSDEKVAQVTAIDPGTCDYTVYDGLIDDVLDADALALAYDPIDPDDFRVLTQMRKDRLAELLAKDPVAIVIGVLQSHQGKIDSDHLEALLSPRHIPAAKWSSWWTKARTALRRCPHVLLEGRNPVILTYHAEGQTLEEEIAPQWAKAENPTQRAAVVDTYLREAKARNAKFHPKLVKRMHKELMGKVKVSRNGAPAEALAEALVIERLAACGELPKDAPRPAVEILRESSDLAALLDQLDDHRFYQQSVEVLRETFPDRWGDLYAEFLPVAPTEACELLAKGLVDAGRQDDLLRITQEILNDFSGKLGALCWLWKGPSIDALEPVPRAELLPRMLEHLADLGLDDKVAADVIKEARQRMRSTFNANDYKHYRRIIKDMEPGMASTIYRSVDRQQGLGQTVRSKMLRIVRETHPQLFVKAKVDPWVDDNIIFCTDAGMRKREEELKHLQNVKIPANAKAIGEAASHGDLSENSEFKFALEERDLLQAQLMSIQQEMSIARLMSAHDVSTDAVDFGTRVRLISDGAPEPIDVTVLGPWEADYEKRIYNYRAPVCGKLKGLRIGDTVTLDLDGNERTYRVEAIENALLRSAPGA